MPILSAGIVRIYSILVRINIHILQPLSPRPQLLRRATTVSRTPLVAALTHTPAARIPTCPGRLLVRADALVPPVYPRHAFIRAARYRQTSLADRYIQDTAAHDLVLLLPCTSVMPNIYEYKRTKYDRIDLVRAHPIRYRTHIQHTCANKYSFIISFSRCCLSPPRARLTSSPPRATPRPTPGQADEEISKSTAPTSVLGARKFEVAQYERSIRGVDSPPLLLRPQLHTHLLSPVQRLIPRPRLRQPHTTRGQRPRRAQPRALQVRRWHEGVSTDEKPAWARGYASGGCVSQKLRPTACGRQ